MGIVNLAGFRTRLQTTLGNRGFTAAELDVWINAGMVEVAGAIEFDGLKYKVDTVLSKGVYEYGLAPDVLAITAVWISGFRGKGKLLRTTPEVIESMDRRREGFPKRYSKRSHTLIVHPTPDQEHLAHMVVMNEPRLMNDAVDTTSFPSTFDSGVHMMAVSAAYLDLGEEHRALVWANRCAAYLGSRLMPQEMGSEAQGEPVRVMGREDSLYSLGDR